MVWQIRDWFIFKVIALLKKFIGDIYKCKDTVHTNKKDVHLFFKSLEKNTNTPISEGYMTVALE